MVTVRTAYITGALVPVMVIALVFTLVANVIVAPIMSGIVISYGATAIIGCGVTAYVSV